MHCVDFCCRFTVCAASIESTNKQATFLQPTTDTAASSTLATASSSDSTGRDGTDTNSYGGHIDQEPDVLEQIQVRVVREARGESYMC
jgi:hypothetical protein